MSRRVMDGDWHTMTNTQLRRHLRRQRRGSWPFPMTFVLLIAEMVGGVVAVAKGSVWVHIFGFSLTVIVVALGLFLDFMLYRARRWWRRVRDAA